MRVLSGIQPSGTLHIGNYFGAIKQYIELQNKHECFYFIANYHALTTSKSAEVLAQNTLEVALTYLSLGLDPQKVALYKQSDLPEVTELSWVLSCLTPMGLLERCHSYKDKVAKGLIPNHGLFAYPVLMAADILLPQSNLVPVGKDQKQHVEVARDIALKFNNEYGETFTIPEPMIKEETMTIPGVDGQKMSKSYNNTLPIFDEEKSLRKKVMGIVTDSTPVEAPKDPDTCNVFALSKLFLDSAQEKKLRDRYQAGGLGYGQVKKELFETLWEYFAEARQKRQEIRKNIDYVHQVLATGANKAREVMLPTIAEVRKKVGIKV